MKIVSKFTITMLLLLTLCSCLIASSPALAKSKSITTTAAKTPKATEDKKAVVQDWVIVPIFYATNRSALGTTDTGVYSEKMNVNGLLFGVKNYAVPLPYNSPFDEATQTKMQWQRIHALAKKHADAPEFDRTKCIVQDKVLSHNEIVPAFDAYRQNTGSPENIIYVHGCCANFDTVMRRAAMVASHTQVPVLVYDWVSPHGFTNYLVNEIMVSQTIDDFCKFIAKVETLMDPKNITFIGHSMGAELVDQAMVRRAELMAINPSMPKFKEVIMSNADVDDELRAETGEERRISGDEDNPATGIRSKKQPRNQEPGARRKRKKKLRTRKRRKKTRVTVTQGTTTTTHHRRLRIDRSPGLPPRNRFPVLNGRPSGTNPGLGVAPQNGPGGDR